MADDAKRAYDEVIHCAFRIAAEDDQHCQPVHLLAALAEGDGPIAQALKSPSGASLFPPRLDPSPARGGTSSYLTMQTQQAARKVAEDRNQPAGPEHLFLAVLDQADPEAIAVLTHAGLDTAALRSVAWQLMGASADLPPIAMPPLVAAGTLDRPPLPIEQLDPAAWAALRWRQDHLPLQRLRRRSHYESLQHLEFRACWKNASRRGLDDDQRYSLMRHHRDRVEQLAAHAHPDLVELRPTQPRRPTAMLVPIRSRRRRRWRRWFGFTVGWGTWFGNRRVGLRDRWFRARTTFDYRRAPQL
ncbi:MAG: Clp protease N-terminal domain-containing protein [Acidimicrobiales bacterium]